MSKILNRLVDILGKEKADYVDVFDEEHKRLYGEPGGACFEIEFNREKKLWYARSIEIERGNLIDEICVSDEREICMAFIKLTDGYLHLSKYIPEFEDAE